MFLPNLLWDVQHDFPFLELMRNIKASGRDTVFTPLGYLKAQIFLMTPVTFSAWLLSALYFFFWTTGKPFRVLGWAFVTVPVALILRGHWLLALFLPVLSLEAFLRYQASLLFSIQPDEKSMAMEPMPHYYSDCFGWEDRVPAVAKAHAMVPPEQRADTAIFAHNFAAAGAVDIIGPKYGLPKVISGHQNYRL